MLVLIVEDDPSVARFIERGLAAHGHQTLVADNGEDGVALALGEHVELVLMDISLPGLDGQRALERIRLRRPGLPVLMLTARDDLPSKVSALDAGADDYLTKPFAFDELLARMRALIRRADQPRATELQAGELRLDLLTRRISRSGTLIELSSRETALLEYFMRHRGHVLSRQQLLSAVWDVDFDPESNVVDVYVSYLRRKLDPPGETSYIATVRGAGYRFEPPAGD